MNKVTGSLFFLLSAALALLALLQLTFLLALLFHITDLKPYALKPDTWLFISLRLLGLFLLATFTKKAFHAGKKRLFGITAQPIIPPDATR